MTPKAVIAVIGGSGLYNMDAITDIEMVSIDTPYGKPSADIRIGTLHGKRVAFLPRHGLRHVYSPTTIPYRANIYALKLLGVRFVIAVSACGSLREDYAPGHIVIPDQLVDYTKANRGRSFFEDGLVAHVSVADPFCTALNAITLDAARSSERVVHAGGSYITIEGPRFSTRGESAIFRTWGCSLIGMTTSPEAFLAREAEMSYSVIAHVTDYDVWHKEPVNAAMVIKTFHENLVSAQAILAGCIERIDETAQFDAHRALDGALTTARNAVDPAILARLHPLITRVLGT